MHATKHDANLIDWNGIQFLAKTLDLTNTPDPSDAWIEREARWMRDSLRIGTITVCRAMIRETIRVWKLRAAIKDNGTHWSHKLTVSGSTVSCETCNEYLVTPTKRAETGCYCNSLADGRCDFCTGTRHAS